MANIKVTYDTKLGKIYLPNHVYQRWQIVKGKYGFLNDASFATFLLHSLEQHYSATDVGVKEEVTEDMSDGCNHEANTQSSSTELDQSDAKTDVVLRRTCFDCVPSRTFARQSACRAHYTRFHEGYQCDICGESLIGHTMYQRHVKSKHSSIQPQNTSRYCARCKETFTTTYFFIRHNYYFHAEGEMFSCEQCGSNFFSLENLKTHVMRQHGNLDSIKSSAKNSIARPCEHCDEIFYNKDDKIKHMKLKHAEISGVTCDICQKRVSDEKYLAVHKSTIHSSKRKVYNCVCSKTFTTSAGRRAHFNAHHRKIRYQCGVEDCGKMYVNKRLLQVHMVTDHEHIEPADQHVCDHCGHRFNHRDKLLGHLKIHLPNTMLCDYCDKSFKLASTLKTHISIAHARIKKFSCQICTKTFGYKAHLKRHLDQVHDEY